MRVFRTERVVWKMKKLICLVLSAVILLCSGCSVLPAILRGNVAERYSNYVKASLDCAFLGETAFYLKQVEATQEQADSLYADSVSGYTTILMNQYEVKADLISEDLAGQFEAQSKRILAGVKYSVAEAVKNSDGDYSVTVTIQPLDLSSVDSDYAELTEWYNDTYSVETLDAMTEEEYAEAEELYAEKFLEKLAAYSIAYQDEVKTTVSILVEDDGNYSISDSDWVMLNEKVLGIDW